MFSQLFLSLLDRRDAEIVTSGDFNSIQEFRLKVEKYYRWYHDGFLNRGSLEKCLFSIWKIDFALRAAVQLEEHLIQRKAMSSQRNHARARNTELSTETQGMVAQGYVLLSQGLYRAEEVLPDGPIKRAYLLLRKDPLWYLHPTLIDQCARNGGCCGRSCNCCQKRRPTEGRRLGVGHCTMLCECCMTTNGISHESLNSELGPTIINSWFRPYEQGELSKNVVWQKTRQAFFYGIKMKH